jgi:hypothetical protein
MSSFIYIYSFAFQKKKKINSKLNFIKCVSSISGYIILGRHRGKRKWGHTSNNPNYESSIDILGERVHQL